MNRRNFIALTAAAASVSKARGGTADAPLLSFGLTTDVQYADADPEGERHYRESIPKLKAAVEDLAKEKLPFTLHLGDMIDRDFSSFATILPLFAPLGHPVRHLPGNHDYTVTESDKAKIIQTLGMPSDYYAFRSSGVKFLMLDTNDVSTYKHPEGSAADLEAEAAMKQLAASGAKNAKPWNGGLSPKQLAWLEKELTDADAAKEAAIVCGHHPMVSEDGLHAWNNEEIIACIKRHPSVRAYFCGHNHAGGEVVSDGVPFITFKSILHEPGITSYAVIRLFSDRLLIEGRGREKSREIKLRT
jgi:manganese-dependent ADP-ribose/CDP-alcohol diphosphatase